jgi:hypothetical protein
VLPREDDILKVNKKDLVNFEIVRILLLEIPPDSLNGTQQVGNAEAKLGYDV